MNTFGSLFRITTFGESHGPGIGVILDGCPSGITLDMDFLAQEMRRRRPGQSRLTTPRKEKDAVQVLSGLTDGKTTGAPLTLFIPTENAKSRDYNHLAEAFRPSHADYTYTAKYGHREFRGGGRSSARETAARVAAGAVAKMWLKEKGVVCQAYVSQVGTVFCEKKYTELNFSKPENIVRCPDEETAQQMIAHIDEVRDAGDSVGGVITGIIRGLPAGLGEPIYDKLHARLGSAMLSINAVKGFEYGSGFAGSAMRGSAHNDAWTKDDTGKVGTKTNFSGGIQGGISNGEDVYFRVAFKPVATLMQDVEGLTKEGETVTLPSKGRHDPCVVPRAVPIVEAMSALVIADFWLLQQARYGG